MALVALIGCLLLAALGATGVASPAGFLRVMRSVQTPMGLYLMAALRVVLGVALFSAASSSRLPELMRVLGVVIIVRGVIMPFLGVERLRMLLERWSAPGSAFVRGWALLTLAVGLWLAYAVAP